MGFNVQMIPSLVPESYSRQLDERVAIQEMPYGYEIVPPSADTGDFDQYTKESHKQYSPRNRYYDEKENSDW